MIKDIKKFTKSGFLRNVVTVATGAAGAHLITFGFTPIITRIYDPEAFGLLGAFIGILSVLTPIAALTYPVAIVLPKSELDAKKIAKLSVLLALFIASLFALIINIGSGWIASALGVKAIEEYLLLVPLAMFFAALHQVMHQWLIRKKHFQIIARTSVIHSLFINSAKVGAGLYSPIIQVLLFITTTSHALYAIFLWYGNLRLFDVQSEYDQHTRSMRELAFRNLDFPLYRAPQVAVNALSQSLPVLILASMAGPLTAGLFVLAKTILASPVALIGTSVGSVFYPKAVELQSDLTRLNYFLFKTTVPLLMLAAVIFSPIIFFGPWLFGFVFGAEWEQSGEFGRWISIWMIVSLAARPAISIIPVLGLQKSFLMLELFFLPMKISSLYFGTLLDNEFLAVSFYCMVSALFYVAIYVLVFRKIIDAQRNENV